MGQGKDNNRLAANQLASGYLSHYGKFPAASLLGSLMSCDCVMETGTLLHYMGMGTELCRPMLLTFPTSTKFLLVQHRISPHCNHGKNKGKQSATRHLALD